MRKRSIDNDKVLRRLAEARLASHPKRSKPREADIESLIHEFQVHQAELEIQNEELRDSRTIIENANKRYSDLYDFAPVGYFTMGKEGRILEVNLTAAELLGLEKRYLIGKPFNVFVHPEDQDVYFLHRGSLGKGAAQTCEIRLVKKSAIVFHAQLVSKPLDGNAGDDEEFLISVIDITMRKFAEEKLVRQNEKIETDRQEWESSVMDLNQRLFVSNRELESLGHTLSHDLRGPLQSLKGFCDILLERYAEKLGAEGKEFLAIIKERAQRMSEMITGLLDITRIMRTEIQRQKIDMSQVVADIVQEYTTAQPAREADVLVQEGLFAQGDDKLLRLALDNLVRNAWKFTGKLPKARIEFGKTENNGKEAFFLRDNGVGFDMKYAGKMFTVFQRLHSEFEFEGSGIGLATAQRVILRHGGEIWAEGEVDKGATFYFTLP